MKVLLVGSGGREHALAWGLKKSPALTQLFIAPGNAGTAQLGQNISIPITDIFRLRCFAQQEKIDLTIVGPEDPIALGIYDLFEQANLKIVAPSKKVSFLEASKVRAKEFLVNHHIPTAPHHAFSDYAMALTYAKSLHAPIVIKADGLAAGKGVVITQTHDDAAKILHSFLIDNQFGAASLHVVVEEFLTGQELSVFVASDGKSWKLLGAAQDYKRLLDNNQGPNTGGMGAISPVPWVNESMLQEITKQIIAPTFAGLQTEGLFYQGILYFGLMWTAKGPYVIEYNIRFGDPETQALVPRFDFDLLGFYQSIAEQKLDRFPLQHKSNYAVCVVAASKGYPEKYEIHIPISGAAEFQPNENQLLFHAGTTLKENKLVTAGGRVLNSVGLGATPTEARERAYALLTKVHFNEMNFRSDIAKL